jgi:hypothetical protein
LGGGGKSWQNPISDWVSPIAVRDYRAYSFGIDGHRFVLVEDFSADHVDDAAALNAAKQLTDTHDLEV